MKIYIVTKGSYSDYHIIAATLDEKKAYELAKRSCSRWEDAEVEVYEDFELVQRDIWRVKFDDSGNVETVEKEDDYECVLGVVNRFCEFNVGYGGRIYVGADTSEEAIKIAAEKRAEYFAHKNGIA